MDNFISTINGQLPKFFAQSLDKKVLLNICDINKREKNSFSLIANKRQSNPNLNKKPVNSTENRYLKDINKQSKPQIYVNNLQSQQSKGLLTQESHIQKKDTRSLKKRSNSEGRLPSLNKLTVELDYDRSKQENFIRVQQIVKPRLTRKNKIELQDRNVTESEKTKVGTKDGGSQNQNEQKQRNGIHFLFDYEKEIKSYQIPSLRIQPRNPSFTIDDPSNSRCKVNINTVINKINEVEKKVKIKNNPSDRCSIAIPPSQLITTKIQYAGPSSNQKSSVKEEIMKKYRLHLMKKVNQREKLKQGSKQDQLVSAWNNYKQEDLIYEESSLF